MYEKLRSKFKRAKAICDFCGFIILNTDSAIKINDTRKNHIFKVSFTRINAIAKTMLITEHARPSQKLCKPPKWCKIGAPNWRYYYEQQKEQKP